MAHTLFTHEIYNGIEWTVTEGKCKKFIELWNEGLPINKIAKSLSMSTTQVTLMVIDFGCLGKIEPRKGGLFN